MKAKSRMDLCARLCLNCGILKNLMAFCEVLPFHLIGSCFDRSLKIRNLVIRVVAPEISESIIFISLLFEIELVLRLNVQINGSRYFIQ